MNDVGIAEHDQRSVWRTQWQQLRGKLDRPIEDEDALLDLLFAPFDVLGLAIYNADDEQSHIIQTHSQWKRLNLGENLPEEAKRNFRWIEDMQSKFLREIIPDWHTVLERRGLLEIVLQQWFSPMSINREDRATIGAIQLCALDTVSVALSDRLPDANGQRRQRPETWNILQKILLSLVDRLSLLSIAHACQDLVSSNKRQLQWTSSIRQLLSLPDRIANAYEGKFPDTLSLPRIRSKVGDEVGMMVQGDVDRLLVSDVISKLLRAGWFQDVQGWEDRSYSVWPAILRRISNRVETGEIRKWPLIVGSMQENDQNALLISLVNALDRVLKKNGKASFINGSELVRPGAEGKEFLSASTWESALIVANVIEIFLPIDQDDGEAKVDVGCLSCLFPNSSSFPTWSPLTARILIHILLKYDTNFQYGESLLLQLVKAWSQQSKVASLDEEVFLSTLMLLLIHVAPSDSEAVKRLSTSPDFINGVTQHLKHLSPSAQRLGMLLAETVSERAGKGINFGKSVWEGKGKGREEARVLRSLALGFKGRQMDVKLGKENMLSSLHLKTITEQAQVQLFKPRAKTTSGPTTRTLPARKPAPTRKPIIQLLDGDSDGEEDFQPESETNDIPSLTNINGSRKLISSISDDEKSSSSESDTSSDEDGPRNDQEGATEEGKAFGMAAPTSKKQLRPPIYIGELAPLLRENERDSVRMGMKYCEDLIRRKAGWGGEVEENAIDLALALLSIHNNFRISQFEQRRIGALTALVVASPTRIGPCLAEQYFDHQYAMAQRIAMLNALAFGAAELATGTKTNARIGNDRKDQQKPALTANKLAEQFSQLAMQRAREEGKERMPEIRNEEALLVSGTHSKTKTQGPRIVEVQKHQGSYTSVANTCFIFPLVNRLWNHIQNSSALAGRSASRYSGSGSRIIDSPFMMGSLIDTIAVLCNYAQNEPRFRQDVIPEVVQLVLTITRSHLSSLAQNATIDDDEEDDGGSRSTILGASASLVLVLLDAAWQLDFVLGICNL
ncbi:uncharacterized protein FA14DRAFT_156833 [Meira miltonrushii]|uniref:Telomere length regulation protein conserved domain-containing protein n=1 Tax=Meira miltonrushii TaxID=1280837 RepID=A0A316V9J7_9BASI|nr:uncharacterized protein FA14DRAFT_156833 [Meira miltonrushii]PWN34170.1 hypothetical protein FA14DRAFT_156833 [Meira miltonrushii]